MKIESMDHDAKFKKYLTGYVKSTAETALQELEKSTYQKYLLFHALSTFIVVTKRMISFG